MEFSTNIYEEKMEKSLSNLQEDYVSIRAGRANPHILDKIQVDYYGTPSPLPIPHPSNHPNQTLLTAG